MVDKPKFARCKTKRLNPGYAKQQINVAAALAFRFRVAAFP